MDEEKKCAQLKFEDFEFIDVKSSHTQHTFSGLSKNLSEYLESKKLNLEAIQLIHIKNKPF